MSNTIDDLRQLGFASTVWAGIARWCNIHVSSLGSVIENMFDPFSILSTNPTTSFPFCSSSTTKRRLSPVALVDS
ncbi:hypothetical protein L1987_13012 [Smallanthus sonchifolius]|uniref:Uncharacterized protein n=1 Tax=Smallanthus sonchifolius TaxID=185202 RepID=A0ACB9JFR1_9ASTR|nr:hypothetical protein L1987_13012 [Smallanthus sonchifolius]